jgi:hypothetical protein
VLQDDWFQGVRVQLQLIVIHASPFDFGIGNTGATCSKIGILETFFKRLHVNDLPLANEGINTLAE